VQWDSFDVPGFDRKPLAGSSTRQYWWYVVDSAAITCNCSSSSEISQTDRSVRGAPTTTTTHAASSIVSSRRRFPQTTKLNHSPVHCRLLRRQREIDSETRRHTDTQTRRRYQQSKQTVPRRRQLSMHVMLPDERHRASRSGTASVGRYFTIDFAEKTVVPCHTHTRRDRIYLWSTSAISQQPWKKPRLELTAASTEQTKRAIAHKSTGNGRRLLRLLLIARRNVVRATNLQRSCSQSGVQMNCNETKYTVYCFPVVFKAFYFILFCRTCTSALDPE